MHANLSETEVPHWSGAGTEEPQVLKKLTFRLDETPTLGQAPSMKVREPLKNNKLLKGIIVCYVWPGEL